MKPKQFMLFILLTALQGKAQEQGSLSLFPRWVIIFLLVKSLLLIRK